MSAPCCTAKTGRHLTAKGRARCPRCRGAAGRVPRAGDRNPVLAAPRGLERNTDGHAAFKAIDLVATDPKTSPKRLIALSQDKRSLVKVSVAANPSTPAGTLARLAQSEDGLVSRSAATNPATPPGTLEMLAKSADLVIRHAAAGNPSTPPQTLVLLADGWGAGIRNQVTGNPSAPPEVLAKLMSDESESVAWSARIRCTSRIVETLGIDESNASAISKMMQYDWWTMTPESPEVLLVLAVHSNL